VTLLKKQQTRPKRSSKPTRKPMKWPSQNGSSAWTRLNSLTSLPS
jgi:hypothetical protein